MLRPRVGPARPLRAAVLDGLVGALAFDGRGGVAIGDGARDFQGAIMGARGGPRRVTSLAGNVSPPAEIAHCFWIIVGAMWALQWVFFSLFQRSLWRLRPSITRARTATRFSLDARAHTQL